MIQKIFSPSPKPETPQHSVATTKSKHAKHLKATTHAKPKPKAHAEAKTASTTPAKKSFTGSTTYTSYGEGAEGAGITDPADTAQTAKGTTGSVRK